jgi:hypothetical protein
MKILVDKLSGHVGKQERDVASYEPQDDQISPAEGQALRSFRTLLLRNDPGRSFGGLRRVQAPAGEFLWVCTQHHPEYDPGLPDIPT